MSVLDFLFQGKPPESVTTYGESSTNVPSWLSDYTKGLIARSNTIAAEPYQAYQGPRVAGFTEDQTKAQKAVRDQFGNWVPQVDAAQATVGGALQQATPYLTQAGQSFPGQAQSYMDPYIGNVIDRAKLEANRNLTENIMPGLDSKFIRGGQYGSSAHEREAYRGARDITEGVNSQALAALSGAYNQAGQNFNQDASRQLQVGSTLGSLALDQGKTQAGLALQRQGMQAADIGALDAVGTQQQQQNQRNLDTAYGDFQAQRDYPRSQAEWLNSIIRGTNVGQTTNTTQTGPMGDSYQPSGLAQIGSLISAYQGIKGLWGDEEEDARGGLAGRRYAHGGLSTPVRQRLLQEMTRRRPVRQLAFRE